MKKIYVVPMVLVFILIPIATGGNNSQTYGDRQSVQHEFLLESVSSKVFSIYCLSGDSLSGEFILTSNGNLFIGDQTKYDNWLLDGIDFLILDAANYELWENDSSVSPLYERKGIVELEWSIEVPSDGTWYIIYYNDSIFMKTVEGSIEHITQSGFTFTLLIIVLIGIPSISALFFRARKKK